MKDWHKFIWEQNGKLDINELSKELPNISKKTIKAYCVRYKVPYKKQAEKNKEWKNYVLLNGHEHTMAELIQKFPKVKPSYLKTFCWLNDIKYILVEPQKSNKKTISSTTYNYFNEKDKYNWLIG